MVEKGKVSNVGLVLGVVFAVAVVIAVLSLSPIARCPRSQGHNPPIVLIVEEVRKAGKEAEPALLASLCADCGGRGKVSPIKWCIIKMLGSTATN